MYTHFTSVLVMAILARSLPCSAVPSCTEVIVPVTITATNLHLPLPTSGPPSYIQINGTYNIAARYCKPEVDIPSRKRILQLLVHGGTYTRDFWSGDAAPGQGYNGSEYSWVSFASSQGYPTLAIDRICNGKSDHPDPIAICQFTANVEVIHQIIQKARLGHFASFTGVSFHKVIYVGHSMGSVAGNLLSATYPKDADATVLTGWSNSFAIQLVGEALSTTPSAAEVNPARYGSLNPAYLILNSSSLFQSLFYNPGYYDPAFFDLDYSLRGTLSLGEGASLGLVYSTVAPQYTRPVFVITGQNDAIFCPSGCVNGNLSVLADSRILYPAAKVFGTFAVPGVGHCWQFHFQPEAGFNATHVWLAQQGF